MVCEVDSYNYEGNNNNNKPNYNQTNDNYKKNYNNNNIYSCDSNRYGKDSIILKL